MRSAVQYILRLCIERMCCACRAGLASVHNQQVDCPIAPATVRFWFPFGTSPSPSKSTTYLLTLLLIPPYCEQRCTVKGSIMQTERVVFRLRKYSWADDKTADGKSNYSHIVADDLCMILEGGLDPCDRLTLQVVQATKVLVGEDSSQECCGHRTELSTDQHRPGLPYQYRHEHSTTISPSKSSRCRSTVADLRCQQRC